MAEIVQTQQSGTATQQYVDNMFANTLVPNYSAVTKFTLMRGVTDFSNLLQYDLYETGYSFLITLKIPRFLDVLRHNNTDYQSLINTYTHILEYDFRGAQGIEDITSDTNALTNGINDVNIITRVNEQSGSSFSMNYFERSGSIITKTHELYLRGIKDPRTQVKRYNGLLQQRFNKQTTTNDNPNRMQEKGYHCEIFHFLLIITDNTALNLEKAYLLTACQPTTAHTTIYNVTKGEIGFSELNVTFNGFPISGRIVNARGEAFLDWINEHTCFDEMNFGYDILGSSNIGISDDGTVNRDGPSSPTISSTNGVESVINNNAGYIPDQNVVYSDYGNWSGDTTPTTTG